MYKSLPPAEQKLQLWAQALPAIEDAENSQREWSEVYFAQWLAKPRDGSLGAIPLVVLTRADGGYKDDLDVPAAQMEQERKDLPIMYLYHPVNVVGLSAKLSGFRPVPDGMIRLQGLSVAK